MRSSTLPLLAHERGHRRNGDTLQEEVGQPFRRDYRTASCLIILCSLFLLWALCAFEKHAPSTPIEPLWLYRIWAPSAYTFVNITRAEIDWWLATVVPRLVQTLLFCATAVGFVSAGALSGISAIIGCVVMGFIGVKVNIISVATSAALLGILSHIWVVPLRFLQWVVQWLSFVVSSFDILARCDVHPIGISLLEWCLVVVLQIMMWALLVLTVAAAVFPFVLMCWGLLVKCLGYTDPHGCFACFALLLAAFCICIGHFTYVARSYVVHELTAFSEQLSLPLLFPTQTTLDTATKDAIMNRFVFWACVFVCKWLLMVASSIFWHTIIIRLPLMCRMARDRGKGIQTNLSTLFLVYHMCHKLVLFALVEIALVNHWLSDHYGFDFEIWNQWMNWILATTNAVAICKYTFNIGVNLERPVTSVLLVLIPGIGADAHFAKDWLFIGVVFKQSQVAQHGASAAFAYLLGIASIATLFVPTIHFLTDTKYQVQPALAWNFVSSHWPIVGAEPVVNAKRSALAERNSLESSQEPLQRSLQEMFTEQMIRQTTPWHKDLIFTSELPQGIIELIFCMSFSWKPAALFAIGLSSFKFFSIQALLGSVSTFVVALGSGKHLVLYAKLHGITIVPILFGKTDAERECNNFLENAVGQTWADKLRKELRKAMKDCKPIAKKEDRKLPDRNVDVELSEGELKACLVKVEATFTEYLASQPRRRFPHMYEAFEDARFRNMVLEEMEANPNVNQILTKLPKVPHEQRRQIARANLKDETVEQSWLTVVANWKSENKERCSDLCEVSPVSMKRGIETWCERASDMGRSDMESSESHGRIVIETREIDDPCGLGRQPSPFDG